MLKFVKYTLANKIVIKTLMSMAFTTSHAATVREDAPVIQL